MGAELSFADPGKCVPTPADPGNGALPTSHIDRYGDALPEGALFRLGTVRFRHGSGPQCIAFSPDGRTIASAAANQDVGIYLY
jgi:hypothetical protein